MYPCAYSDRNVSMRVISMRRKLCFEILGRESINIDKTRSLGQQHDDRLNNLIPVNAFHIVKFHTVRFTIRVIYSLIRVIRRTTCHFPEKPRVMK